MNLVETLHRVKTAIDPKNPIELYRCFCFRDGFVYGYNGEVGIAEKCDLPLNCCVSAERLYRMVSGLEDARITQNQTAISVSGGTYRGKLQIQDSRPYPNAIPEKFGRLEGAQQLSASLKAVLFSAGPSMQSQHPDGVGIAGRFIYSTDGNRGTRLKLLGKPVDKPIVLPPSGAKVLAGFGEPEQWLQAENVLMALYSDTGTFVAVRQYAKKFPFQHLEDQFNRFALPRIWDIPEGLARAVDRVMAITGSTSEARSGIVLTSKEGTLTVRSIVAEVGEAEESVPFERSQEFGVKVSSVFLKDALKIFKQVDLSDILEGQRGQLRFVNGNLEHLVALMV